MAANPSDISTALDWTDLQTGDRMTREEFHRIYVQSPKSFKAELVRGIVYVASPLKRRHGTMHPALATLFYTYQGHTPGVETGDNTTILLGEEGEPQPDLYLRILPEFGGQSQTTRDDYVQGAPELLTEIAGSSRAIDLHDKRHDYRQYGVREYLVVILKEKTIRWFDLRADQELQPDADGVFRLRCFPGLWMNANALFAGDFGRLMTTLNEGLVTPEHADFVKRLAARKT
jgi:hypothetical protein